MARITMSLTKVTKKANLEYSKDCIAYMITMNNKKDWENEGSDYLRALEMYLNECKIIYYVYKDSFQYHSIQSIKFILIVSKAYENEFKEAYKEFKTDYKLIIKKYEVKEIEENFDPKQQDFINEQELNETAEILKEFEDKAKELEEIIDNEPEFQIETFVFAGNATFTLESELTGNRYTYKVRQCEDKKELYFVSLLTGSDNENDFSYIGIIENGKFRTTKKSKFNFDSTPVKAFNFFICKLHKLSEIQGLNVFHAGRCGKCGRTLTTPESIKTGFGPHCLESL